MASRTTTTPGWRSSASARTGHGTRRSTVQGDAYFGRMGDAQNISTYTPPTVNVVSYAPTDTIGGNLLGPLAAAASRTDSDLYLQGFWSHDRSSGSNFGETRDTFDFDFLHRTPATRRQQFTYGAGFRVSPSTIFQTASTDSTSSPAQKTDSDLRAFCRMRFALLPNRLTFTVGIEAGAQQLHGI